jgi:hypothetical protein
LISDTTDDESRRVIVHDLNYEYVIVFSKWMDKLNDQDDPFIRFVLLWLVFESWLSYLAGDKNPLDWFFENDSNLKNWVTTELKKKEIKKSLSNLRAQSPIPDHKKNTEIELRNITDIKELITFIYRVRCNLFHGHKKPDDPRDKQLVRSSEQFLSSLLKNAIGDEKTK